MKVFPSAAACLLAAAAWPAAPALELDSVARDLLEPNGIIARDLDVFPPSVRPDTLRLTRVEAVLRNPFRLDGVVGEVLSRTEPPVGLPLSPDSLWPLLDEAPPRPQDLGSGVAFRPGAALEAVRAGLAEHVAGLAGADQSFLYREASPLFLQNVEDTSRNAVENDLHRQREDARIVRLMELARKLRRPGLARAASAAWSLETWMIRSFRSPADRPAALAVLRREAARAGIPLHVGSSGPDRHRPDRGIWIDPGGDDEYVLEGSARPGSFLLVLDLEGRDTYRGRDSLHRSPGNMGVSVLADLAGDDHYLGENFAFGAALFGYAQVYDAAGDDYYEGRCASLGFGFFGVGMIQDAAGNDVYSASQLSEGAASTRGLGLLLDQDGHDRYLARPTFQDDLRYTDHFLNMMQGFSTGFAPDYPGGLGVLRDQRGNDAYLADIFAQGSSYWYAMGLLLDEAGDDRYEAHQYAQGAGVHMGVGAAVDYAGSDHRASKGVSQGCGHDYGFGLLYDRQGNDNYLATDMSQGAGSANGLGVLQDAAGDDVYQSLNPEMTLGHADMRRDRGSFGFLLDQGGKDRYPALPGASSLRGDGKAWRVFDGKTKGNGYGLDR